MASEGKKAAAEAVPRVRVTMVRSLIGRPWRHRLTARSLGLRRIGDSREHRLTPQIRGMVKQLEHLLKVEEIEG